MKIEVNEQFAKQLDILSKKHIGEMLSQMVEDIEPLVPYDTGDLRNSAKVNAKHGSISYGSDKVDYAAKVYYDESLNLKTPGTVHRWVEVAAEQFGEEWTNRIANSVMKDIDK